MKESTMDWQITQIFLSDTGVHEVFVQQDTHKLRCNCPGYSERSACKHIRFVKARMDKNGGIYPVEISTRISREESIEASYDPIAFRELLVNYGKIEAI